LNAEKILALRMVTHIFVEIVAWNAMLGKCRLNVGVEKFYRYTLNAGMDAVDPGT
jgi:hypothetical protein